MSPYHQQPASEEEEKLLNRLIGINLIRNVKHNLYSKRDPTVNDDKTKKFSECSFWVNETTNSVFICTDASQGAALCVRHGPEVDHAIQE